MTFVRTRFAPSPTGSLHVGGTRTALYCLLVARKAGGRFLLRIEDTDRTRSTEEAAEGILRDLRWLGLLWDEGPERDPDGTGPFFQSGRLPSYQRIYQQLGDRAYQAWDTPEELTALREAAREAKQDFRYTRRSYTPDQLERFQREGRSPVLRFERPGHGFTIDDVILGEVTLGPEDLDDFVIQKADGYPTYHLAVVADDLAMGVTHVIRGQEHLLNTPKHLGLYEALGAEPPIYAHLPLILNPTGGKMSKRDKARAAREVARAHVKAQGLEDLSQRTNLDPETLQAFLDKKHDRVDTAEAIAQALGLALPLIEVMDFRKAGYLPEGLINYLALLGWSAGDDREFYPDLQSLVDAFDLRRVGKTGARFDVDKLTAINKQHIMAASIDRLKDAHDAYLEVTPHSPFHALDADRRRGLLALYQPRIDTFRDLDAQAHLFFGPPDTYAPKAVRKHVLKGGGLDHFRAAHSALASLSSWTEDDLRSQFQQLADAHAEGKLGKVIQPVRVALTGDGVSPGIEDTLLILGREEVLRRLSAFEEWIEREGATP